MNLNGDLSSATLRPAVSYVFPLRRDRLLDDETAAYLRQLSIEVDEVIVVDGSPPAIFDAHDRTWGREVTHVAPDPDRRTANGKVAAVVTGLVRARNDVVVTADDDVRYSADRLRQVVERLGTSEAVCPQNVFAPLPWHARWDTARMLVHRAIDHDMPGTIAVRRSFVATLGGYEGDVLFENLELLRTISSAGGRIEHARDVFVDRRPPSTRHFFGQRVRQAYDEFARPWRMVAWLSILPIVVSSMRRRVRVIVALALGSILLAERGRRRDGGIRAFSASASLWAPLWLAERAVCAWLAVLARARGGVCYHGVRIRRAATPSRRLRERAAARTDRIVAPVPLGTARQEARSG